MSVDVTQLQKLRDGFRDARENIRRTLMSDLEWGAEQVKLKMRENAPVDTGFLRDNIHVIKIGNAYEIGPVNVPYARPQEYGAKPHTITAGPGKTLAFMMNGKMVFVKSVKHPGNKAQPYIRPAGDWAREEMPERIKVTGASMLRKKS